MPHNDRAGLTATVLICSFNRARLLRATLTSLARITLPGARSWDVLIVDNNSTDDTAAVVRELQAAFPVPLRYLHEPRQGKSYALNSGLAASDSTFVAFTDDDVVVEPGMAGRGDRPDAVGRAARLHRRSRLPGVGSPAPSLARRSAK